MWTRYFQNVLGVHQWIKPRSWDDIYTLYSSLDKEILILTLEEYSNSHQELVARIMKSLNQKKYCVVYWKDVNRSEILKNLLFRSKAQKCIAFGRQWTEVLNSFFLSPAREFQEISLGKEVQIPVLISYSLSQLSDESDGDLKQKKLSTFSDLKKFLFVP